MAYNSKYTGEQVEELLDKVYTFNLANITTMDIEDMPYILGVDGGQLVKANNPNYIEQYTFDMSLITSSNANIGVQMGWQDDSGTLVDAPFTLNGTAYNSGTSEVNYWSNSTTEHTYNVVSVGNAGSTYVFYVNPAANYYSVTSATITSNLPRVNLAHCFQEGDSLTSIESSKLNVCNLASTFEECYKYTDLTGIANWNVASVTSMERTFSSCANLTDLSPIANWNVAEVKDMSFMFAGCSNLTTLDGLANWNTASLTNMAYTFYHCSNLTTLDGLANWNTASVTNMGSTFSYCSNLTTLDGLANWNTASVTSMAYTFSRCNRLSDLTPLANWNTASVTNMSYTFSRCNRLSDLTPLANWNTASVTSMANTFNNCTSLSDLSGIANWNTASVTNMRYTFSYCSNLTDITALNNWTGANANCYYMFYNCTNIGGNVAIHWNITCAANMFANRNTALNVYASTATNAYNAIYAAMGNSTTNSSWNVTLYELSE